MSTFCEPIYSFLNSINWVVRQCFSEGLSNQMKMVSSCTGPVNTPQALNLNTYLSMDKTCNVSLQISDAVTTSACVGGVTLVQCTDSTVCIYFIDFTMLNMICFCLQFSSFLCIMFIFPGCFNFKFCLLDMCTGYGC